MPFDETEKAEIKKEVRKELDAIAMRAVKFFVYGLLFFGGIAFLANLPTCAA